MYPQRELTGWPLQDRVAVGLALRRTQCAEAAARVAQPLAWLDGAGLLATLSSFAPISPCCWLGCHAHGFSRRKILGSLLRWAPLVFGLVRGLAPPSRSVANRSTSTTGADRTPMNFSL